VGPPNYKSSGGQVLSSVGAVIAADQGPANDMFFLSFDQFGTFSHAYVEPTYTATSPVPTAAQPEMGVATFERVYHAMSGITGVPFTNAAVATVYNSVQQSMPSAPQINAFLASHQTAISQMAGVYCAQLVGTQSYRDKFFAGTGLSGLDAAINGNASASSYFGSGGATGQANIDSVVTPLVSAIVGPAINGTTPYPQAASGMRTELNNLLLRIPTLPLTTPANVSAATIAACNAALGSAAATMQ
jgi:hypothetical protein